MKTHNNFSISINTVLKNLIEEKSKRDNIKFTSYQLANILSMPRSIISKLTHPNKSKRMVNPRIETLLKIVEFFRADGFDVTIDTFLGINRSAVDVPSQVLLLENKTKSVPLYSLNDINQSKGTVQVKLPQSSNAILALYLEENREPFFKMGSIFIVDRDIKPVNNHLIALTFNTSEKVYIKKYYNEKNKILLKSLDEEKKIMLMPTQVHRIIGVVIQVNAKT